jgi:hypothetical protein
MRELLPILIASLDPTFCVIAGMGIGYVLTMVFFEYRNHGRMQECDLLRWQNGKLTQLLEEHVLSQSPDCDAAAAPKPVAALVNHSEGD